MFKIKDKTIHLTRGDVAAFEFNALTADGNEYVFKKGDVIRFKVMKKKECDNIVIKKDVVFDTDATSISFALSGDETKIGDVINKPVVYWYEIELNPDTAPQTIVGFDEEGEKQFILYPEGSDE